MRGVGRIPACLLLLLPATACADLQSALSPRGPEAGSIALLSWILFAGGTAIFVLVMIAAAVALFGPVRWRAVMANERWIIGGGIVFPAVTLAVLLVYGLILMRPVPADAGGEPLRITVIGEQWWWRVIYRDGEPVESANELRVPVDVPVELSLETADVIHSFWVPNLGGKVDMIPGRTNRLRLTAGEAGISRGQCAEYCGGAHALMSFFVVALPPEEYRIWRQREAQPARPPSDEARAAGLELFLAGGCGACHAIRGTEARGTIGPDLTHLGSRHSLAAGTLRNDRASIARWIAESRHVKPENLMPPYGIFTDAERDLIATYLAGLE